MWPHITRSSFVHIALSPDTLACSLFVDTNNKRYQLKAYERSHLDMELMNSRLFNPTTIRTRIAAFLRANKLRTTYGALCLHAATTEMMIELPGPSPTLQDFPQETWGRIAWQAHYLYPNNHSHTFYVAGISSMAIAQYQLLAITIPLNITLVTTTKMALINLYKRLAGSSFRPAQFGQDMRTHAHHIEQLFTDEMKQRLSSWITLDQKLLTQEQAWLLPLFGLF